MPKCDCHVCGKPDGEIRYLGDAERLSLAPDDIIVLTLPGSPTREVYDRVHSHLVDVFGEDRKFMILADGIKLGVLAPEAA